MLLGMLFLVPVILTGCKKSEAVLDPMRQFTPTGNVKSTSSVSSVKLEWAKPVNTSGKVNYTVQVSKDSLFNTVERFYKTDTSGVTLTDDSIPVRTKYYARIKALGTSAALDSKWLVSTGFSILGEQLFKPVRALEIKETSIKLRWIFSAGISRMVLTPATGAAVEIALSNTDIVNETANGIITTSGYKEITGLAAAMTYKAELYSGTKSKGVITFTTLAATAYTQILNPGDDLATAIAGAANNAVIGLKPGTYTLAVATTILQKSITLKSTSGNRNDTRINFKEFTLKGTGAGIRFYGLDLDGGGTAYFINLIGAGSEAEAAAFNSVIVDNSLVHNTANCFMRANRAAVNAHKIDLVSVTNSVLYDNGGSYDFFTFDKLQFTSLELTKSTFYNIGRALLNCPSVTSGAIPKVLIDQCTFNNFGSDTKYVVMDANTNPVNFTMQNCILGNIPKTGGAVQTALIRAGAANSTLSFMSNNLFKTSAGAVPAVALTLPAAAVSNKTIDLGWTAATIDFTLPSGSELRTSGTTSGPLGDPQWSY